MAKEKQAAEDANRPKSFCTMGHLQTFTRTVPPDYKSGKAQCDNCRVEIDIPKSKGFYHCETCQEDTCLACSEKRQAQLHQETDGVSFNPEAFAQQQFESLEAFNIKKLNK
jgi:hypothetical protein